MQQPHNKPDNSWVGSQTENMVRLYGSLCFIGESGTRPDWWHARLPGDERSLLPKEVASSIVDLNCDEDLPEEILPATDFERQVVAMYVLDVRESNGEMRARFGVGSMPGQP